MIKNYKTGVVIVPKEIVEIIEKGEKTTTEIKSVYDYFLKYKETNKIFELRKDDEVKRITKVVFDEENETIETDLFVISEDSFEEKNIETVIQELETGIQELETSITNKQDLLVSGTNIKTINNESILGSGNIEIQSGTQLYLHSIRINTEYSTGGVGKEVISHLSFILINNDSTVYDTANKLNVRLYNNGFRTPSYNGKYLAVKGGEFKYQGNDNKYFYDYIVGLFSASSGSGMVNYVVERHETDSSYTVPTDRGTITSYFLGGILYDDVMEL